jgi:hypothetical protein
MDKVISNAKSAWDQSTTPTPLEDLKAVKKLFPEMDSSGVKKGAVLSLCGRYRYSLHRIWDASKPMVNFIGLNPSKADGESDDQTIRKMMGFASRWEMGGIIVTNLFGLRATIPKDMKSASDPIGPDNKYHLQINCCRSERVVVCWGDDGSHLERDIEVLQILSDLNKTPWCFGTTMKGMPKHPSRLPYSTELTPYLVKEVIAKADSESIFHDPIEGVDGSDVQRVLKELVARGGPDAILGKFLADALNDYWSTVDSWSVDQR